MKKLIGIIMMLIIIVGTVVSAFAEEQKIYLDGEKLDEIAQSVYDQLYDWHYPDSAAEAQKERFMLMNKYPIALHIGAIDEDNDFGNITDLGNYFSYELRKVVIQMFVDAYTETQKFVDKDMYYPEFLDRGRGDVYQDLEFCYNDIDLKVDEIKDILKYTDLGFDYDKDEIKAYVYGFQAYGTSLIITNGEKEWFLRIKEFFPGTNPIQFEDRVYSAQEVFDALVKNLSYRENINFVPSGHVHVFDEKWQFNRHIHWKECSCGKQSETYAHSFDEGTIIEEPTAEKEGKIVYTCSVCNYEVTKSVAKLESESSISENSQISEISEAENSTPDSTETTNTPLIIAVIALSAAVVALIISLFAVSKKKKG